MPWQAQLFIGVPVHDYKEAWGVMRQLGSPLPEYDKMDEDDLDEQLDNFYEIRIHKKIQFRGKEEEIEIVFSKEEEGGSRFPVRRSEEYTDAIVGFGLTSRYSPALLDQGHKHGRPEPFCFKPQEIIDILAQVHEWWPEAEVMIWDQWY